MKNFIKSSLILFLLIFVFSCSKDSDSTSQSGGEVIIEPEDEAIDFQTQMDIGDDMNDLYGALLLENTAENSRELLVEELKITDGIKDAGISEDSTTVWWEYNDGLEYYFSTVTAFSNLTSKSSESVKKQIFSTLNDPIIPENKNVLVMSPYYYQFLFLTKSDETDYIATLLNDNNYNVTYKLNKKASDSNITLDDYKQFEDYSVIAISTHGGLFKQRDNSTEIYLSSGIKATEEIMASLKDHIDAKRIAVGRSFEWWSPDFLKDEVLVLGSSWFEYEYKTKLNQTLIYMGSCKSYYNKTLADALVGNESAYFGWTHNASFDASKKASKDLFNNLFEGKTVEEAYEQVVKNGNSVDYDGTPPAIFKKSSNSYNDLALKDICSSSPIITNVTIDCHESGNLHEFYLDFEANGGGYNPNGSYSGASIESYPILLEFREHEGGGWATASNGYSPELISGNSNQGTYRFYLSLGSSSFTCDPNKISNPTEYEWKKGWRLSLNIYECDYRSPYSEFQLFYLY